MSERVLIFLDVDGVLNSMRSIVAYRNCRTEHLDQIAIRLLDRLCEALAEAGLEPEVVISSTWRMLFKRKSWWNELFAGHDCTAVRVVGATGELWDNEPNRRGREVAQWLAKHAPDARWVALDDDRDFLPDQPLIWIDPDVGLQIGDIDAAYRALVGQPMPHLPRIIRAPATA